MPSRTSSIKYFKCLGKRHIASQCPNRCVIIVKDDGKIGSESSIGEVGTSSESKSLSDGSYYEEDLLVVRRLMNTHVREEAETQRENIFHSRCLILGNLSSMTIDGGSCMNVASERLVKKLVIPTIIHLRPYRFQSLSEKREFNIKCFKCLGKGHIALHCPNKRSMIMKENGIVDNASSKFESSSISEVDASC
ncbi:hypothetical protein CR513_03221, partial [Mucuna pruriens]